VGRTAKELCCEPWQVKIFSFPKHPYLLWYTATYFVTTGCTFLRGKAAGGMKSTTSTTRYAFMASIGTASCSQLYRLCYWRQMGQNCSSTPPMLFSTKFARSDLSHKRGVRPNFKSLHLQLVSLAWGACLFPSSAKNTYSGMLFSLKKVTNVRNVGPQFWFIAWANLDRLCLL